MVSLQPYLDVLLQATNLTINQAKVVLYFCVFTHCRNPRYKPPLELNGESGTGKNIIMELMKGWCNAPKWIKADQMSEATLRNKLAGSITALIEEADKTKDPKPCEGWYKLRYDSRSSHIVYNAILSVGSRTKKRNIFGEVKANHYGYTVLHTQNPFSAIELDRRIIRIYIAKDTSRTYTLPETPLDNRAMRQLAQEVDWDSPILGNGSAFDCWMPLMLVATHLGDEEFLAYAREQIELKTEDSNLSKVFEPKGVVLGEIASHYSDCLTAGKDRIPITSIAAAIKARELQFYPDERQVTKYAKQLGFRIFYPQNLAHIRVLSEEFLLAILVEHGTGVESETPLEVEE